MSFFSFSFPALRPSRSFSYFILLLSSFLFVRLILFCFYYHKYEYRVLFVSCNAPGLRILYCAFNFRVQYAGMILHSQTF